MSGNLHHIHLLSSNTKIQNHKPKTKNKPKNKSTTTKNIYIQSNTKILPYLIYYPNRVSYINSKINHLQTYVLIKFLINIKLSFPKIKFPTISSKLMIKLPPKPSTIPINTSYTKITFQQKSDDLIHIPLKFSYQFSNN